MILVFSFFVNQLFDSFEEALSIANQENESILDYEISLLPSNEKNEKKIEELRKQHKLVINQYKELEQIIENNTIDMEVTKTYRPLDSLIERVFENSREFYLKIANILSIEEIECLKLLIENKSCLNCTNGTCRVETSEKSASDICVAWDNKELIGRQRLLIKKEDI